MTDLRGMTIPVQVQKMIEGMTDSKSNIFVRNNYRNNLQALAEYITVNVDRFVAEYNTKVSPSERD